MSIKINEDTAITLLKALNDSFMRYARIIIIDERNSKDVKYLNAVFQVMKSYRDTADTLVDTLENVYGADEKYSRYKVSPYVFNQVESSIAKKV